MKSRLIYLLYHLLEAAALPLIPFYCLYRGLRTPAYFTGLAQRFGFLPRTYQQTIPGAIWLHAVSVGEVICSVELVKTLAGGPSPAPVFVSTATLAGRAAAEQKLSGVAAGIFYAPFDFVFAVRAVLRSLKPAVVIVLETEVWPNLFREVSRSGAGLVIVNGRISDRALPRYRALRWFLPHVLRWPDRILAQSREMQRRFAAIGAPPERLPVAGNLKYDAPPWPAPPDSPVRRFLERCRPARVWIAASTMPPRDPGDPDEDDAVIAAFKRLSAGRPNLLLLLAPRRPERFDPVARKLEAAGVRFVRRSRLAEAAFDLPGVLLLDTIGELSGLFPLADAVFLGGTLASRGGHNLLEPAGFGRAVVVGPHMENFQDIFDEFHRAGACVAIGADSELEPAVARLLDDPRLSAEIGSRAQASANSSRGAAAAAVEEVRKLQQTCLPCVRPGLPVFLLLWPWAKLWRWGARRKRLRDMRRRKRLQAKVISVGNITTGGTGKTPFVLWLAGRLTAAGRKPGIVSRGYGRHSHARHLIAAAGERVPVIHTGDEPQIFIRSGLAPVGIGPDRHHSGSLLERRFDVDAIILDDGFQHFRLRRDMDIVLIDGLNPFGGCEAVPLGRLREPLEALSRASVFVVTRSDWSRSRAAIEKRLRRYNPAAPVFHARVVAEAWVELRTGRSFGVDRLPHRRVGALCALGNPESFWQTLHGLGVETVERLPFSDHHHYRPADIRHIVQQIRQAGGEAAVTTEKDIMNLCEGCEELFAPLPLYWLKIRMEVEREPELLREIERYLAP